MFHHQLNLKKFESSQKMNLIFSHYIMLLKQFWLRYQMKCQTWKLANWNSVFLIEGAQQPNNPTTTPDTEANVMMHLRFFRLVIIVWHLMLASSSTDGVFDWSTHWRCGPNHSGLLHPATALRSPPRLPSLLDFWRRPGPEDTDGGSR